MVSYGWDLEGAVAEYLRPFLSTSYVRGVPLVSAPFLNDAD